MNQPIGFLDSGLGGISVLKEVRKLLPNEDYFYYGDSFHHPYGEKAKKELYDIVNDGVKYLLSKNCKLIVIACNTATTMVLAELRKNYTDVLFVGTEPAIKVAHDFYPDKRVLVLATKGTIESERFHFLQENYPVKEAYFVACPKLAPLIEEGDSSKFDTYLKEILLPYKGKVDVIVLGCTHYVFVKDDIKKIMGDIILLDGNLGIAKRVKSLLKDKKLLSSNREGSVEIINNLSEDMQRRSYQLLK